MQLWCSRSAVVSQPSAEAAIAGSLARQARLALVLLMGVIAHSAVVIANPYRTNSGAASEGAAPPHHPFGHLPEVLIKQVSASNAVLKLPMLSPRRNHCCAVIDHDNEETLVLVSGRFAPNVELLSLSSGRQRVAIDHSREAKALLELNHVAAEVVPSMNGDGQEIWVMCGFRGHEIDTEISVKHVRIIHTNDWTVEMGPALDVPRGACSTFKMDAPLPGMRTHDRQQVDPAQEAGRAMDGRLVCVAGGMDGTHSHGFSLSTVSCYDRVKHVWWLLPELPEVLDHHASVMVPPGACDASDPARLMVWNGRHEAWGPTTASMMELGLDTASLQQGWKYWPEGPPSLAGAAAATFAGGGRYLVNTGGVGYFGPGGRGYKLKGTHVVDLCAKRVCAPPQGALMFPRWATWGCSTADGAQFFVCGGDSEGPQLLPNRNEPTCEVFDLPSLVESCADHWLQLNVSTVVGLVRQELAARRGSTAKKMLLNFDKHFKVVAA